jgi:hypothetical protein
MKNLSKQPLQVVLGSQTIKAFVAAPKEFNVLGIVRMGLEFGLLATNATGDYVRVNGSLVQSLNTQAVEDAIHFARCNGRGESYATSRGQGATTPSLATPTVIVRKRRRLNADGYQTNAVNAPQHAVAA